MKIKGPGGKDVPCPRCGSHNVRYSDGMMLWDLVMSFFKRHALRCRDCRARFYAQTDEAANWMWTSKS